MRLGGPSQGYRASRGQPTLRHRRASCGRTWGRHRTRPLRAEAVSRLCPSEQTSRRNDSYLDSGLNGSSHHVCRTRPAQVKGYHEIGLAAFEHMLVADRPRCASVGYPRRRVVLTRDTMSKRPILRYPIGASGTALDDRHDPRREVNQDRAIDVVQGVVNGLAIRPVSTPADEDPHVTPQVTRVWSSVIRSVRGTSKGIRPQQGMVAEPYGVSSGH